MITKIITIDDNPICHTILGMIIDDAGITEVRELYECAIDALKFFETAIDSPESDRLLPDLILLDINMPVMDGWEFLDAYRQLEIKKDIDIYILSSTVDPEEIQRAADHPMVRGFLSKPPDASEIRRVAEMIRSAESRFID